MSKRELRYCNGCGAKLEKEQIEKVKKGDITFCELCGKELSSEPTQRFSEAGNVNILKTNNFENLKISDEIQEDLEDLEETMEQIEESIDRVKEAEDEERKTAQEVNKAKKNYEFAKKSNSPKDQEISLKKLNKKIARHKSKQKKLRKAQERAQKYQRKAYKIKTDVESTPNYSSIGDSIGEKVENWTSGLLKRIDAEIHGKTGQNLKDLIGQLASGEAQDAINTALESQPPSNIAKLIEDPNIASDSVSKSEIFPPFSSYTGDEPFIFISYAHRDKVSVYPEIEKLHMDGFKIWYDQGIPLSTKWNDEVAKKLKDSSCLLVFISTQSIKSQNIQNEINFALKYEKKIVPVYLEETVLPGGLELQLVSIQGIYKYKMTEEQYHDKIREDLQKMLN